MEQYKKKSKQEDSQEGISKNVEFEKTQRIYRLVMRIAGVFIIISTILSLIHSHYWSYFTLFVGLNLFQYSLTKFCPLEIILRKVIK